MLGRPGPPSWRATLAGRDVLWAERTRDGVRLGHVEGEQPVARTPAAQRAEGQEEGTGSPNTLCVVKRPSECLRI